MLLTTLLLWLFEKSSSLITLLMGNEKCVVCAPSWASGQGAEHLQEMENS